jgi:AcrR family transcriptional regulator
MGRRAESKVLAGAPRSGILRASGTSDTPKLEPETSPKRQRILDGMLEAVGAEGYERTSVRTVLDRTGIYRQAFYDNFTDKDSCYLQAYDAGVWQLEERLRSAAAAETGWTEQLRAGLGELLDFLDAEPDVGRALIVEVHAAGPAALAKRADAMQRVVAFLDQARESAGETSSTTPIAGEGAAGGIYSVIHSRLATGSNDGFRSLLPEFMYFAVLPYFGAEVAAAEMQPA